MQLVSQEKIWKKINIRFTFETFVIIFCTHLYMQKSFKHKHMNQHQFLYELFFLYILISLAYFPYNVNHRSVIESIEKIMQKKLSTLEKILTPNSNPFHIEIVFLHSRIELYLHLSYCTVGAIQTSSEFMIECNYATSDEKKMPKIHIKIIDFSSSRSSTLVRLSQTIRRKKCDDTLSKHLFCKEHNFE